MGQIIFVVARQTELFQHERLFQNIRRDARVGFDMVARLAGGDFKCRTELRLFQPALIFQPHVDRDVINRRRFVRGDKIGFLVERTVDAFRAGANEMV